MRQGSVIAILLGLLVGAALLFLLDDGPRELEPDTPITSDPAAEAPALDGSGMRADSSGKVEVTGWVFADGRPTAARVVGHLLARGVPLDRVRPETLTGTPAAEAQSSADSGFTLRVAEAGTYLVGASRGAEPPRSWRRVQLQRGSNRLQLTIPTGPHTATVVVQDAQGTPVQAVIRAVGSAAATLSADMRGPLRTNAAGRLSLRGLYGGALSLIAVLPGGARVEAPAAQIPRKTPIIIVAPGALHAAPIQVVDNDTGRGVPAARIHAASQIEGGGSWHHDATTDEEGRLTLRLPAARIAIRTMAPGYDSDPWRPAVASETTLTIRLRRRPSVHGRVVQAEGGAPVAGVYVRTVEIWQGELSSGLGGRSERTDAEGHFRASGHWWTRKMAYVFDGGWMSVGLADCTDVYNPLVVDPAEITAEGLTLPVVPAPQIHGVVQTADGTPIPNVTLDCEQWEVREKHSNHLIDGPLTQRAYSGPDGRFSMQLVPGWVWYLSAEGGGYYLSGQQRIRPVIGENAPIVVTVERDEEPEEASPPEGVRTTPLEILVVDSETGTPTRGAAVSVQRTRGFYTPVLASTRTGSDGIAVFPDLPEAPLRAVARTGTQTTAGVDIAADQGEARIALSAGRSIRGTVVIPDEQGRPVAGARLTIYERTGVGAGRFRRIDTDVIWSGTEFTIAPLPNGTYDLYAEYLDVGREYKSESQRLLAGETARLTLVAKAGGRRTRKRVIGKGDLIVRAPDGEAIEDARLLWLSVAPDGKLGSTLWSIDNGVGNVLTVRNGQGYIDIVSPRLASRRRPPLGALRIGPILPGREPGRLEVTLPPERLISGRVVGPDGEALVGVRLTAYAEPPSGAEAERNPWAHARTFSGPDGRFAIRQLGDLAYDIQVGGGPGALGTTVRGVDAGTGNMRIELRRSIDVQVTIVDAAGERVPEARVEVHAERPTYGLTDWGSAQASDVTDAQGVARLRGLDPDFEYKLTYAGPYGTKRRLPSVVVDPWRPRDEERAFPGTHTATGRVRLADGSAFNGTTRIQLIPGDPRFEQRPVSATVGPDGRFSIANAPPGPARLMLTNSEFPMPPEMKITVPSPPVEFVIHSEPSIQCAVPAVIPAGERVSWRLTRSRAADEDRDWIQGGGGQERPLRFRGLDAGRRYGLWAHARIDERVIGIWAPDLKPGAVLPATAWGPLGTVRVNVVAHPSVPDAIRATVRPIHPLLKHQRARGRGLLTLHNMPAGTHPIRVRLRYDGVLYSGTAEIATGGEGTITLTREE